jgi:predicted nucleic-acid-binding Zn-ribbon protein
MNLTSCPNCNGRNLYEGPNVSAGGGHAPNYLPGLGTWWQAETFQPVVCRDCGLTRFFASRKAREKLADAAKWKRVP